MQTSGFITIDEIVMDLKYRGQDYTMVNYDYWFHLCIKAIQKMNIFNMRSSAIAYLSVPSTGIITLPEDYIDYVQIGVVDSNGIFRPLTYNPNIFPVPQAECGDDTSTTLNAQQELQQPLFGYGGPYTLYGASIPTLYGASGGLNAGYYNINRQTNQLLVSGLTTGTAIALEYKNSGIITNGVTMVRIQMQEAIISWCMMTAQEFGVIKSQTNWANKYYGDEAELEWLDQALTADELKDILYGTWKQSPKR